MLRGGAMSRKTLLNLFMLLVFVSLSACNGEAQLTSAVTATPDLNLLATLVQQTVAVFETRYAQPTNTQIPTETPSPTVIPSATATLLPTLTPTETLSPTPVADFTKFKLLSVGKKEFGFQLVIQVPGLQSLADVQVAGKPFTCQIESTFPDRLYCNGPELKMDKELQIQFISKAGAPLYSGFIFIPKSIFGFQYPEGIDWDACPERGQSVSCETENRTWFEPPCVVSTCVDKCGYFYSIDTCKQSTPPADFPNP
jgi:hypothetical protein